MLKVEYSDAEQLKISPREIQRMEGLLIQLTKNTALGIKEREAELKDTIQGCLRALNEIR